MAKRDAKTPQTKQSPVPVTPEIRTASVIVLACVVAILVALTIKLFRWITGF